MVRLYEHYMTAAQRVEQERSDNQKQVESILRMGENEQSGPHGIWAITSTERGQYMTGRRVQGVHWWSEWLSTYDGSVDNRAACRMVTQGDTVVAVVVQDALRTENPLWP